MKIVLTQLLVAKLQLLDVITTTGVQLIMWTRIKGLSYICSVAPQNIPHRVH